MHWGRFTLVPWLFVVFQNYLLVKIAQIAQCHGRINKTLFLFLDPISVLGFGRGRGGRGAEGAEEAKGDKEDKGGKEGIGGIFRFVEIGML